MSDDAVRVGDKVRVPGRDEVETVEALAPGRYGAEAGVRSDAGHLEHWLASRLTVVGRPDAR